MVRDGIRAARRTFGGLYVLASARLLGAAHLEASGTPAVRATTSFQEQVGPPAMVIMSKSIRSKHLSVMAVSAHRSSGRRRLNYVPLRDDESSIGVCLSKRRGTDRSPDAAMPPSGGEPYYEIRAKASRCPAMGEIPTSSDGCCDTGYCGPSLTPGTYWGSFELLMWWRRGQELPPLVTTSTLGTPIDDAGVLGFDSTTILYGNEQVDRDARAGGRLTVGAWLDGCGMLGSRITVLCTWQDVDNLRNQQRSYPILARPFYDVVLDRKLGCRRVSGRDGRWVESRRARM